jgi:hypothetical protein
MSSGFPLFAQPWWVNLLILIPLFAYAAFRRASLTLGWRTLLYAGLFAAGFGYVEASVVIYLRAAVGLLPGYGGSLQDVARVSSQVYQQSHVVGELPRALLKVEVMREAATMLMLLTVTLLAARPAASAGRCFSGVLRPGTRCTTSAFG